LTPSFKIWNNLNLSAGELAGKKTTGWIYLILVAFFNTIPLFILSILANLSSVSASCHQRKNLFSLRLISLADLRRSLPRPVEHRVPKILRLCIWCLTPRYLFPVWIPITPPVPVALKIPRGYNSVASGSSRHRPLLRVPCHLPIDHLHPYWRHL
jgi:hypothetical protein